MYRLKEILLLVYLITDVRSFTFFGLPFNLKRGAIAIKVMRLCQHLIVGKIT